MAGDSGQLGLGAFQIYIPGPANRIGSETLSVTQLKILQECITLAVFSVLAFFMFDEKPTVNSIISYVFIVGAVYFAFRG